MFEYIKGTLIEADPLRAIIDVNGIGYKINIPSSHYSELLHMKGEITLYTKLVVKEDSHTLYGFLTKIHKDLFELVTTVSGIGAKTGLLLLGYLDIENLYAAISNADVRLISKVPGIGKKTSERLILELRDKLKIIDKKGGSILQSNKSSVTSDAINTLMNLGYSSILSQKAVKTALNDFEKEPDLSKLISASLQKI